MRSGDQLTEISPTESELIVEIRISPADIGQLELGLPVDIGLDAFDSSIYGKLEGELIYLSSDTLSEKDAQGRTETYYRGRVRVDQEAKAADPKLAPLTLRSGYDCGAVTFAQASGLYCILLRSPFCGDFLGCRRRSDAESLSCIDEISRPRPKTRMHAGEKTTVRRFYTQPLLATSQ